MADDTTIGTQQASVAVGSLNADLSEVARQEQAFVAAPITTRKRRTVRHFETMPLVAGPHSKASYGYRDGGVVVIEELQDLPADVSDQRYMLQREIEAAGAADGTGKWNRRRIRSAMRKAQYLASRMADHSVPDERMLPASGTRRSFSVAPVSIHATHKANAGISNGGTPHSAAASELRKVFERDTKV